MCATGTGVSILMATYNGVSYIAEQLDSIVAQAAADDEIIIVDDGSSDGTLQILGAYASRFPTIRVSPNPRNIGVKATFERLLGLATRDIIFLSDQDDIWIEGRKASMVETLRQDGCVAVLANALILTEEGVGKPFFAPGDDPEVESVWRNFAKNGFIGCCMALRREVLAVALPFPPTISMHDWWIGTCAMTVGQVRYLPAPSLLYRRHSFNQSSSTRRRWRVVMRDRRGNLLALAALLRRHMRFRRPG
jgi:glycosyltransferase involved in cell wall biosynthesis